MSRKQTFTIALAAGSLLIAALGGCAATRPETIATVEGPATSGVVARRLEILGMLKLSTVSGNLADASNSHFVQALVEVPVGTALIMPALTGWMLGFGSAQPNPANPDAEINWTTDDDNWGLGSVEVSVVQINPPNSVVQPTTQTAELSIRFYLSDDDQDDPWFGAASYTLLCLGLPGVEAWEPIAMDPPIYYPVIRGR